MSNNNNTSTPVRTGGLSLYANLLDPTNASTPGSISKAPVIFKNPSAESADDASAKKPQIDAATLRFQPTRRPQLQQQKPKPRANFPKAVVADATITAAAKPAETVKPVAKPTLADWANVEDETFYEGEKRQRGGRKKRKKNREEQVLAQDWDDIYDPTRPNNYEEYRHSDEKIREVREWKDRLYAHRMARQSSEKDSDEEEEAYRPQMGNQFAPPANYSFAPPPMGSPLPPPPPETEKDPAHEPPAFTAETQPPPPPPPPSAGTISRAPVRYNLPAAPTEIPSSEAELEKALEEEEDDDQKESPAATDEPRSLRPGQKGFAERLMSKYGWSKGSGLGADGSGITTALRVQVEKKKKKEGESGSALGARGKIIGGKRKEGADQGGKFGPMSNVVVLRGMVDGMDLDEEVEGSGGLMQEIGEECGEKYGRVERVFIDRSDLAAPKVFVKFTAELSALRAVNALEGRIFNGNTITALFYDSEHFEQGVYDK